MKLSNAPAAEASERQSVGASKRKHAPRSTLRRFTLYGLTLLTLLILAAGAYFAWTKLAPKSGAEDASAKPFATENVNELSVTFLHPKGQLQHGMNEIRIEFRDTASGQLIDVGTVKVDLDMNMPGMVMHSSATVQPTGTPGQYRAEIKPEMAGDWTAKLSYQGPRGNGSVSFSLNVKP